MSNTTTAGSFVWYELLTTDPEAAMAFYTQIFEWSATKLDGRHGHVMFSSSQGPIASATILPDSAKQLGAPPFWNANVHVENAHETCALAQTLGGRVYNGPIDVPEIGQVAVVADPFGAVLNVIAPHQPMKAHTRETPGEVCWHELLTENTTAALEFYEKLYGWSKSKDLDMGPLGRYALFANGARDIGGVFDKPKDVPVSAWIFYFQVRSLDAAMEQATRAGAKVCSGPMVVPSGGRVVQMTDPQGAAFAMHENPKT